MNFKFNLFGTKNSSWDALQLCFWVKNSKGKRSPPIGQKHVFAVSAICWRQSALLKIRLNASTNRVGPKRLLIKHKKSYRLVFVSFLNSRNWSSYLNLFDFVVMKIYSNFQLKSLNLEKLGHSCFDGSRSADWLSAGRQFDESIADSRNKKATGSGSAQTMNRYGQLNPKDEEKFLSFWNFLKKKS